MFNFKIGQKLKIEANKKKNIRCEVVAVHESFILVKQKYYKECFLMNSFICGDLKILGGLT
ncbi:MAG: hypothetical protein RR891_02570 [Clostridium sp.]